MTGTVGQRIAWWVLVLTFIGGTVIGLVSSRAGTADDLVVIAFVAYAVVGALVAARRPENPIGWIFLAVGALTGLAAAAGAGARAAFELPPPTPWWGVLSAWLQAWYWYPLFLLATTWTVLLYPSGLPSRRWRPVLWLAIICTVALSVMSALSPTLTLWINDQPEPGEGREVANPLAQGLLRVSDTTADSIITVLAILALLTGLAAVISAVLRTRKARGVERLQMRLFAFSCATLVLVIVWGEQVGQAVGNSWLSGILFAAAMSAIPVSCGVAILRYRLYDIDRIIGRTTAYAIVTGLLLAVYSAVVTLVTRLLPEQSSSFAVAAATLAAAALFRPVLSRVQAYVDRRFNRSRYDAQRTVEAFAGRLRDEVDPDEVSDDLLAVLAETVQPKVAGLWLRERSS